jgi:catechol 2,3-dioxygenase-like lactoylglutathione lyase family enzyme
VRQRAHRSLESGPLPPLCSWLVIPRPRLSFAMRPLSPAFRGFGDQKLNLHQAGREFEPKALRPTPGAIDLCFTTDVPLDEVAAHLRAESVVIEHGPIDKIGARRSLRSLYFRDPDGNLIEVSNEIVASR